MTAATEQPDWRIEAEAFIRVVDPSYLGPVYLCDMLETGTVPNGARGITNPYLDVQLRETRRAQGDWQGRGFACLINAAEILKHNPSRLEAVRAIVATVLHEYAHWLVAPLPENESMLDELIASTPKLARCFLDPITVKRANPELPTWQHHAGDEFGRVALHTIYRAYRAAPDYKFLCSDIWEAADCYRLAEAAEYFRALGREPLERIREPLRSIASSPLPERYAEFCKQDLARAEFAAQQQTHKENHEHHD